MKKQNSFGARLRRKGKSPKNGWGALPCGKPNRHRVANPMGLSK
mgnify:CR=1 FL=1|tara:strand:- start:26 stop:157 length:132 start_codon:yes stop_codon:yes gene_type:complete